MKYWLNIAKIFITLPPMQAKSVACRRLLFVFLGAIIIFSGLAYRVVELSLQDLAPRAYQSAHKNNVERGRILDRNGYALATSLNAYSLYVDPAEVMDPYETTVKLSDILPDISEEQIFEKVTRDNRYVELSWRVSPAVYQKTLQLGVVGVHAKKRTTRVYPQKEEAAHIVGYVNKDNKGISGIENSMNDKLSQGEDVYLSIDIAVQAMLRNEIEKQIAQFDAIGGAGVVIDVNTGEILALASLPQYDANQYAKADDDARFNRATLGLYELGSTFKIINTAIALDSSVFKATDIVDIETPIKIGRYSINDYHPRPGPLNIAEVMIVSSNKGSARIAEAFGVRTQKKYLNNLGLTSRLDLELPEVATPIVPNPWRRPSLISISFGHGISVTLTHLAAAIATTVGDGNRVLPSLIKGGKHKDFDEKIFQKNTTQTIRAIMYRVVNHKQGTGRFARSKGYAVGGKTGTAEKVKRGGYDTKLNIASFVAAFPAHAPRYVVAIMVDEPKGQGFSYGYATGGWVAAPAVGNFIARAAPVLGVAPTDEKSPEIRKLLKVALPQLDAEAKNAAF